MESLVFKYLLCMHFINPCVGWFWRKSWTAVGSERLKWHLVLLTFGYTCFVCGIAICFLDGVILDCSLERCGGFLFVCVSPWCLTRTKELENNHRCLIIWKAPFKVLKLTKYFHFSATWKKKKETVQLRPFKTFGNLLCLHLEWNYLGRNQK